ncbi:hypothetical protein O3M35_008195 [Rhynocoris fuscipes]|uniref:RNase H type-1 domain-containing protein n=1 Tax=Rhynocoris fuscipes TaxID=488301 RepID=A0AAW1D644_9HEMI
MHMIHIFAKLVIPMYKGSGVALGNHAIVFHAETVGIIVENIQEEFQEVRIFSDSQSVLIAFDKPCWNTKLVGDCRRRLSAQAQRKIVRLFWVPGHTGIEVNEKADQLARTTLSTPFCGPEPVIALMKQYCEGEIRILHYTRK